MGCKTMFAGALMSLALAGCSDDPTPAADTGTEPTGTDDGNESTGTTPDVGGVEAEVTYHGDIRALVERHCVSCHQPGAIAPFPLTNYEQVHTMREAIALSVEHGTMPPWMPDDDCREYQGSRSLAPEEIELVGAWLAEGAHEGSPDDYQAPDIPEPPQLSRVDRTLTLPEPYVPAQMPDDYRCFLLDWPETEDSYVTGFTAAPDDTATVHHMIAFAIPPSQVAEYEALDEAEPGSGYTCFGGPGGAITDADSAGVWLGAWAPGGVAGDFPAGTGIPMQPGSKVVLQVHYNTSSGTPSPDQSSVEFKIDAQVDRPAFMMLWANPDWLFGDMPIPAGEPSTVHAWDLDPTLFMDFLTDIIPPNEPFRIYAATAHMHTLGTRAEQVIRRSDGSETCLLSIPRWDFNWQQQYRFEETVVFNPGDSLRSECEWNNEAGSQDVNWGDGTGDEMCLSIFYATAI